MAQPLWLNNLIKIDNKHIFKKTWVKKGIFFVNDLIDENGNIYSKQTLCEKYNLPVTFLEYYGLIAAIPMEWKNTVKGCNKLENVSCKNVVYLREHQKVTKYFTKLLIERLKPDTISSKTKWDIKLNLALDDDKWVKINNQTFQLSDDTLLRTFQYKINNRILYTNDKLYIFKLTDTELCSFCTETKETLLHHLWECHFVKTMWIRLKEALNNALQTNIPLQPEVFIFNIYEGEYSGVVNTCFLLIKQYIYNCKCNDKLPSFEQAISYVKYYKNIEISSCFYYSASKAKQTKERWEYISQVFHL